MRAKRRVPQKASRCWIDFLREEVVAYLPGDTRISVPCVP
jgi:hypothetical protein